MKRIIIFLLIVITINISCGGNDNKDNSVSASYRVLTVAGTGDPGLVDGEEAKFYYPHDLVVVDENIFVADTNNHSLRQIDSEGIVSTVSLIGVNYPRAIDAALGKIYLLNQRLGSIIVYDLNNNQQEDISLLDFNVAGTKVDYPSDLVVNAQSEIFISDSANNRILVYDQQKNTLELVAGGEVGYLDGIGAQAKFNQPRGLSFSQDKNSLIVADFNNNLIRKINLQTKNVETVAGQTSPGLFNGSGEDVKFFGPIAVAVDQYDNIYVADYFNNVIRRISSGGQVIIFAGSGEVGSKNDVRSKAEFNKPSSIVDVDGTFYISDTNNHLIRKIIID